MCDFLDKELLTWSGNILTCLPPLLPLPYLQYVCHRVNATVTGLPQGQFETCEARPKLGGRLVTRWVSFLGRDGKALALTSRIFVRNHAYALALFIHLHQHFLQSLKQTSFTVYLLTTGMEEPWRRE
jgi:hypothetical protein